MVQNSPESDQSAAATNSENSPAASIQSRNSPPPSHRLVAGLSVTAGGFPANGIVPNAPNLGASPFPPGPNRVTTQAVVHAPATGQQVQQPQVAAARGGAPGHRRPEIQNALFNTPVLNVD